MIETVLCYIENEKNEYLMLYRNKRKNDSNEGKYLGIGGHIEKGEAPDEALIREVYEEVGIRLTSYRKRGIVDFINTSYSERMHLYVAKVDKFPLPSCNEGTLYWINKGDILSLPLWEGDYVFLNKLLDNDDIFNIRLIYDNDKFIRSEEV